MNSRFEPPAKSFVVLPDNTPTGAFSLIPPADGCGPGTEPCAHPSCARARAAAEKPCAACGEPPGFGVAIYDYPKRHGHAACFDEGVFAGKKRFIEDLVKLAIDQFKEGKWPPTRLARPSEPSGPCPACEHKECAAHRARAETACFECGQPIGYERLYVHRPRGLAHADCAKVDAAEMQKYRSDVIGVDEPPKEYVESVVPRFGLSEFDIFVKIPIGRGRGGRPRKTEAKVETVGEPAPNHPIAGRWAVALDDGQTSEEDFMQFGKVGTGTFKLGSTSGSLQGEEGTRDGLPSVEFSWEGTNLEGAATHGRGWVVVSPQGSLKGKVMTHGGPSMALAAVRVTRRRALPRRPEQEHGTRTRGVPK